MFRARLSNRVGVKPVITRSGAGLTPDVTDNLTVTDGTSASPSLPLDRSAPDGLRCGGSCALLRANRAMEHYRAVIKVDLHRRRQHRVHPERRDRPVRLSRVPRRPALRAARHQRRSGWPSPSGWPAAIVAQTGADAHGERDRLDAARGARRRPLRDQRGAGRRLRRDARADFDIPARYGVRQTIGDTLGHRRDLPRPADDPGDHRAGRRTCSTYCPHAYLLNYCNPMAMLPWAVYAGHAASAGVRPVPLGPGHSGVPDRAGRRRPRTGSGSSPRASTTRRSCCGSRRTASPCIRGWPRSSPRRPSCSAGSGWRSTAGSATSRPSPASTPPSTCPGSCATTTRWRSSASSSGDYLARSRGEPARA